MVSALTAAYFASLTLDMDIIQNKSILSMIRCANDSPDLIWEIQNLPYKKQLF